VDIPETRYTKTADGTHIAYQVVGDGPFDIVYAGSSYTSNVELQWDWPIARSFITGLAARSRLIFFDRRGTGLSDKVTGDHLPTLEARAEDIHAVMDAADVERAVLCSMEDGSAMTFVFAATYPARTRALVALNPVSKGSWAPDAHWLRTRAELDEYLDRVETDWGTQAFFDDLASEVMPSLSTDPGFIRSYAGLVRQSISAADAMSIERMWFETDMRHVLPVIQAPSLIIYDPMIQVSPEEEVRYVAQHIPGGTFAAISGTPDWAEFFDHVDRFLASLTHEEAEFDRVLATVLFTDIVGSTAQATDMGDRAWHELLERHHATVRAMLGRYRGREISTAGDGFLATFEGPARAIRCASAITEAVQSLGLEIRAGLHTGEIEMVGEDVRGVAVHIGARVSALAGASEVLVSQTVKDLVAGSGLTFEDAGEHELKGVPDRWHLYRVAN
jgi:class 3 adenylate cyclase/pimeloyl-ACP methyl ester carboxylesterase